MLTVACVYVKGPYPYSADYVVRLERMVRRYLSRPFRFVCLADCETVAELFGKVTTIVVDSLADVVPRNGVGYWNKLRVFDPALGFQGRMLFLDLDTIVVAPLDPIVDFPASLALTTDALAAERAHLDRDRFNRRLVRRFNSSVMIWDGGRHSELWTDWTPAVADDLSTDQDWIAAHACNAVGMPLEWFPRISQVRPPWPSDAKVVLCKKPKNHDAIRRWPELEEWWGGWAA